MENYLAKIFQELHHFIGPKLVFRRYRNEKTYVGVGSLLAGRCVKLRRSQMAAYPRYPYAVDTGDCQELDVERLPKSFIFPTVSSKEDDHADVGY